MIRIISGVLILLTIAVFFYSAIVPLKGFDVAMGIIIGLCLGWLIGGISASIRAREEERDKLQRER